MCPRASRTLITLAAVLAFTLVGCGGSSSSTSTPSTNYTVGGSITGLTVSSVVLANGTATVTISPGVSTWTFASTFVAGSSYAVTVKTQPTGEQCEVTSGGSGVNTGNVGNVTVVCAFGQWTWKGGVAMGNASGVYGTQGTAAASNAPGARYSASSWKDSSGNFWLFGGLGYGATGGSGSLNDLWKYSPSANEWTWVGGASVGNAPGVYGTQGTAAAGNAPGARYSASSWIDSSGNLWLFGGIGYGATGGAGNLNDLWRYTPSTNEWTWISGGSGDNAQGVYGTKGTAAAGNAPGARYSADSWVDSSGNLWLFGGYGDDSTGALGNLNDLWRYTPSTNEWTWISGASGDDAEGVYGTEGTAAASNVPGARYSGSSWADASGNLWLFGGYGYDSANTLGKLNDLWKYSISSGQWTWIGGEAVADGSGAYGTLDTAATTSVPGARQAASTWVDSSGNLWLFGGVGYDSIGAVGNLNDLWKYSPSANEWTWVSGGNVADASGNYGTQGTGAVSNVPGARSSASAWIDSTGNLWVFGGNGYDSTGSLGSLNDLWQYNPTTGT